MSRIQDHWRQLPYHPWVELSPDLSHTSSKGRACAPVTLLSSIHNCGVGQPETAFSEQSADLSRLLSSRSERSLL